MNFPAYMEYLSRVFYQNTGVAVFNRLKCNQMRNRIYISGKISALHPKNSTMNFAEAEQQRALLSGRLGRGEITQDAYTEAVNGIRVTDSSGRWLQPDPRGSNHLSSLLRYRYLTIILYFLIFRIIRRTAASNNTI